MTHPTNEELDALDIMSDLKHLVDDEGDVLSRASLQLITTLRAQLAAANPHAALDRMMRAKREKAQSSLAKIGLEVVTFCAAYQLDIQEVFDHIAWLGKSRDMEKSK